MSDGCNQRRDLNPKPDCTPDPNPDLDLTPNRIVPAKVQSEEIGLPGLGPEEMERESKMTLPPLQEGGHGGQGGQSRATNSEGGQQTGDRGESIVAASFGLVSPLGGGSFSASPAPASAAAPAAAAPAAAARQSAAAEDAYSSRLSRTSRNSRSSSFLPRSRDRTK